MSTAGKIAAFLCAAFLTLLLPMETLAAEAPYSGYSYNYSGMSVPAPVTYMPESVYYGQDMGSDDLKGARDLLVYDDKIYIADTGNNRILVLDDRFQTIKVMTEFTTAKGKTTTLNEPTGLFCKGDLLYIADSKNGRVIAVNNDGLIVRTLKRPNSALLSDTNDFLPTKVLVDYGDNVYVICLGCYYGFVAYNAADEFTGFFGGNEVQLSTSLLSLQFWKSIFSKKQRESLERAVPVEYSNAYIKGDFIYTCTQITQNSTNELQKLNPVGDNILMATSSVGYDNTNFGDVETVTYRQTKTDNSFVDVFVDDQDIIALLDQERGRVFLYDQDCNFLGTFGVTGSQKGTMKTPSALDKIGDTYLVLDSAKDCINTYKKSEYMQQIEIGLSYYSQGLYEQSVEAWQSALQYNSQCSLAYISIGKAYLQKGDYQQAMTCFRKGKDRQSYSRALREYRKQVLSKYFIPIIAGVVVIILLLKKGISLLLRRLGVVKVKKSISFS